MIQPVQPRCSQPARQPQGAERNSDRFGKTKTSENRLLQVSRILMLIDLLAPLRYGATIADLVQDVSESMEQSFCDRTIRRDLNMLETLNVVQLTREYRNGSRLKTLVARISPTYQRAKTLAAAGMVTSEFFDE